MSDKKENNYLRLSRHKLKKVFYSHQEQWQWSPYFPYLFRSKPSSETKKRHPNNIINFTVAYSKDKYKMRKLISEEEKA